MSSQQKQQTKSPLHDFPVTLLKWTTKKDRPLPTPPTIEPVGPGPAQARLGPRPEEGEKQWNLRPRKSVGGGVAAADAGGGGGGGGDGGESGGGGGKRKFRIELTKEEIEADIIALTGSKPARRPKKYPKNVQRNLDTMFPGLWLVGLTPESYRNMDPTHKGI